MNLAFDWESTLARIATGQSGTDDARAVRDLIEENGRLREQLEIELDDFVGELIG